MDIFDFIVSSGELLDLNPNENQILKVRQKFSKYLENENIDFNEIDDGSPDREDFASLVYHYLNKYFITSSNIVQLIYGNSSWCLVPLEDKLVTPEVVKNLIASYDNGYGSNYANAVNNINPNFITPDVIDFIYKMNKDEVSDFIENVNGLPQATVARGKEILSSLNENMVLKRIMQLSGNKN